jgi:hypothetical protein
VPIYWGHVSLGYLFYLLIGAFHTIGGGTFGNGFMFSFGMAQLEALLFLQGGMITSSNGDYDLF